MHICIQPKQEKAFPHLNKQLKFQIWYEQLIVIHVFSQNRTQKDNSCDVLPFKYLKWFQNYNLTV